MERLSFALLALLAHWFTPIYNARLQFLESQIRMLRSRIDTSRIVPSPEEKDELLRLGAELNHEIADLMHVVQPQTYRKWLNHFMCFSRDQLDYITDTWVRHYNTERPHRGVGMENDVLDRSFRPMPRGTIRCKQKLGGLIKSYYREAA